MNSESKVALEADQITQELRDKEAGEILKELADADEGMKNPEKAICKMFMQKQDVTLFYAFRYERLFILGLSEIPVNEIANFLVEHFKKLNANISQTRVYDVLPTRFKSHKQNDNTGELESNSRNGNENSSLNTDFEKENEEEIQITDEIIDFWKSRKNKLQHSHYESLLPDHIKKENPERRKNIKTIIRIANALHDDRQSVPLELQHLLVHAFAHQTNNDAAGRYVSYVKDFGANRSKKADELREKLAKAGEEFIKSPDTLTPKQGTKIFWGHVAKVAQIYDPMTRDESLECGYHGTQCANVKCRSWRTYLDFDASELACRCYACGESTTRGVASKCKNCYLPFYDEVIVTMKNTAKEIADGSVLKTSCPNCNEDVYLPIQKLVAILVGTK